MSTSAIGHVHSRACSGVAVIVYLGVDGQRREWPVGAWICPADTDVTTETTLRAHLARWMPSCTFIECRITADLP